MEIHTHRDLKKAKNEMRMKKKDESPHLKDLFSGEKDRLGKKGPSALHVRETCSRLGTKLRLAKGVFAPVIIYRAARMQRLATGTPTLSYKRAKDTGIYQKNKAPEYAFRGKLICL